MCSRRLAVTIFLFLLTVIVFTSMNVDVDFLYAKSPDVQLGAIPSTTGDNWVRTGKSKLVLALTFWEQLTMATNNLFHLVRVSSHWGARVVVPFTRNSRLFGLPQAGMLPLDLVFDVGKLMNLMSTKFKLPPMEHFDEFISRGSRNVIFISLYYDRFTRHQAVDCYRKASRLALSPLNEIAQRRNLSLFRIAHCCSLNGKLVITPDAISNMCKLTEFEDYTVIIRNWRGFVCVPRQPRLVIPSLCRQGKHLINGTTGSYPHSQFVFGNATMFIWSQLQDKGYIGVHIRGDSLIVRNRSVPGIIPQCFSQLSSVLFNLTSTYPGFPTLLFGDHKVSSVFGGNLRQHNLTHLHFNPLQFGASADNGFVAQVESCIAARAQVLVIVGGGSFAAQIMARYKHNSATAGNSRVMYLICTVESRVDTVSIRKW